MPCEVRLSVIRGQPSFGCGLISAEMNREPGVDMTLLMINLSSKRLAAGELESWAYGRRSPPTVRRTRITDWVSVSYLLVG